VHVGLKKKKPLFGYAPEWCACDLFLVVGMWNNVASCKIDHFT
jgi:hypothetical protein